MKRYVFQPLGRIWRQPSFVICCLVLAISASGILIATEKFQWSFRKLPIPLQKPLDQLDPLRLGPYHLVHVSEIPEEIVEELGTRDYLSWRLEDTSLSPKDPFRDVMFFVTYYTGNPDKVPHIPDVCYVGSGGQLGQAENLEITVPGCGAPDNRLPVRLLQISIPGDFGWRNQVVIYFFSANGEYCCTRDQVRMTQNNLRDRYAYFSKVEMTFPSAVASDKQLYLQAAEKLARHVVPILYRDHWPDWQAVKKQKEEKTESR
jgi:hypothetical protein